MEAMVGVKGEKRQNRNFVKNVEQGDRYGEKKLERALCTVWCGKRGALQAKRAPVHASRTTPYAARGACLLKRGSYSVSFYSHCKYGLTAKDLLQALTNLCHELTV